MKEYPNIEDLLIEGKDRVISPEIERDIMEYMEKWEEERRKNQAQAIIDARNTFIW